MLCTTSETEHEVVHAKLVKAPPVNHYWPFQSGSFVVVLCCVFFVSEFRLRVTLRVIILYLVRFGLLSGNFWERDSHSVDHMLSVFIVFVILVISCFSFEGWIWVLIASVPDLCMLFTSIIESFNIEYIPDKI